MFDDFKLLHNTVGINQMVSLEVDPGVYKRATFNRPLKCIKLVQQSATDYIANMDPDDSKHVFWLDYTEPSRIGAQIDDFCRLLSTLNEYDIIRITLNANPAALGSPSPQDVNLWEYRLETLRNRLGDFVPTSITPRQLVKKRYPTVLLSCLKKAYLNTVEWQERRFLPLYSTVYDDNTQMLTLTGIVIMCEENGKIFKRNQELRKYCNFSWDKPLYICMPALTPKEILHINNELPIKSDGKLIGEKYAFIFKDDPDALRSYLRFYREYPNFHSINL